MIHVNAAYSETTKCCPMSEQLFQVVAAISRRVSQSSSKVHQQVKDSRETVLRSHHLLKTQQIYPYAWNAPGDPAIVSVP
ncbi:hypothetical protein DES45_106364 [Microvirga subterranea]|uniref:Uncharacterized protein n=1 Tax=Microvirga subterranea TaxID=186651 RepID=A0A370HJU6_9HYPH|nr:hypothetical protein DES45_106364 [Microvirga subterranea]